MPAPPRRFHPLVVLSPLALACFVAVGVVNYRAARASLHDEFTKASLPLLRDNIHSEISRDLTQAVDIASAMSHDTFLGDWIASGEEDPAAVTRYLSRIKKVYGFDSAFLVSAASRVYYYADGIGKKVDPSDPHDVWYYGFLESPDRFRLDVDADENAAGRPTIFVNFKIFDKDQALLGVTGVGVGMESFSAFLATMQERYDRSIYLVDVDGVVQASADRGEAERVDLGTETGIGEAAKGLLVRKGDPVDASFRTEEGETLLSVRYLPQLDWFLVVRQDESAALVGVRDSFKLTILLGVVLTIALIVVSALMIDRFNRDLRLQADTDALTGAGNRRTLEEALAALAYRKARYGTAASAVLIDVDRFKAINDTYGHHRGDAVLKALCRIARSRARPLDHVARWGGDEICVAVEGDAAAAAALARRIAEGLRADPDFGAAVTLSMGVAELAEGEDTDDLIRRADKALYRAKEGGRDRIELDAGPAEGGSAEGGPAAG